MANLETQILDGIIVKNRRKMLTFGATSLAGMLLGGATEAKAQTATYSDSDILNFALNLEYLESNFYYQAAFGTTIDVANAASTAAGAPLIALTGTGAGTVGTPGGAAVGGSKVPFTTIQVASYAIETAVEEGKHVATLLNALSSAAVAQPAINIGTAFQMLGANLSPAVPNFTPYDNDYDFLLGAYIFEDVGVTAYHGAAKLLTVSKNLATAAGILAVEGYHAGLIRTTIYLIDNAPGSTTNGALTAVTNSISTLRATLSMAGLLGKTPAVSDYDNQPDDYGMATFNTPTPVGGAPVTSARIVDADPTDSVAFARNTTQVLNIVTGGGAVSSGVAVSPAKGIFFPAGMNAGPNGFK